MCNRNEEHEKFLSEIFKASKVEHLPNVYFIGPFGKKVSFASQQKRALNAILALQENGIIPGRADEFGLESKPSKLCIVGAGIAGVTAAACLFELGFHVTIYEEADDVLKKQLRAYHRYIHPTINFWPKEKFVPTTSLPLLNWDEGNCNQVIQRIDGLWRGISKLNFTNSHIFTNFRSKVTSFEFAGSQNEVRVNFTDSTNNVQQSLPFDFVLVTTGFGDDIVEDTHNSLVSQFPYWIPDGIERLENSKDKITIVGTGDGGLIDLFRLCFEYFSNGKMCIELVNILNQNKELLIKIHQADEKVKSKYKNENSDASSEAYYEAYSDLLSIGLDNLIDKYSPLEIRKSNAVQRSLYKEHVINRIQLFGENKFPFDHNSSTIHKILIAKILKDNPNIYQKGKYLKETNQIFCENLELKVDGPLIIRIGANPPIKNLIKESFAKAGVSEEDFKKAYSELLTGQSLLSDLTATSKFDELKVRLREQRPFRLQYNRNERYYWTQKYLDISRYLNSSDYFEGCASVSHGKDCFYWRINSQPFIEKYGRELLVELQNYVPNEMYGERLEFKPEGNTGTVVRR